MNKDNDLAPPTPKSGGTGRDLDLNFAYLIDIVSI